MNAPNIDPKVAEGIAVLVEQIRRGISDTLCRLSRQVTEGGLDSHELHGLFVALDGASAIRIELGLSEHDADEDDEDATESEVQS